jgi:hypothetical protein
MKAEEQPKISVVIRKRPLNKKELARNETDVISVKFGETVLVSEYKYLLNHSGKRSILLNILRKVYSILTSPLIKQQVTRT